VAPLVHAPGTLLLHAGGLVAPFAQVEVFGVHVPETMEKPEAQVLQDGGFVAPFVQGVGVLLLHVGGFVALRYSVFLYFGNWGGVGVPIRNGLTIIMPIIFLISAFIFDLYKRHFVEAR
jgi:hypothetical protein